MNYSEIIEKTKIYVKSQCESESSGHDWWHIYRVHKLTVYIAKKENAHLFLCEMAALLHDLDDWKFHATHSNKAELWLKNLQLDEKTTGKICKIIEQVSYKGYADSEPPDIYEAKIVQDADRLDAIGAVGVARAFAYGGFKNRELFNPDVKPVLHKTFEEYKNAQSTTINHFYEKLLFLKDRMNTQTAKALAEKRHEFLENFLKNFYEEWFFDEENPFSQK